MEVLNGIASFVEGHLASSVVAGGVVLEVGLRLFKSEKPLSILLGVSKILHLISKISLGIASFLDKIIPQRLK